VPITNYGLIIAYSLGIFERALQPFPAALEALAKARARAGAAATPHVAPQEVLDEIGDAQVDDL
jgi:hypothetical protein